LRVHFDRVRGRVELLVNLRETLRHLVRSEKPCRDLLLVFAKHLGPHIPIIDGGTLFLN